MPCGKGDTPLFRATNYCGRPDHIHARALWLQTGNGLKCSRHLADYPPLRAFSSPVAAPALSHSHGSHNYIPNTTSKLGIQMFKAARSQAHNRAGPAATSRGSFYQTKLFMTKRTQAAEIPSHGSSTPNVSEGKTKRPSASGFSKSFFTKRTQPRGIPNKFSPNEPKPSKFHNIFINERTQQPIDNIQNSNNSVSAQSALPAIPNLRYSGDSNA